MEGGSDRGSTPLASTKLILNGLHSFWVLAKNRAKNRREHDH